MRMTARLALATLLFSTGVAAQTIPYRVLDEPLAAGIGVEAAADFNNDGFEDLLTPAGILLGDGHANFRPAPGAPLATPFAPMTRVCARVADLNGDGLMDLVSIGAYG